MSLDLEGRLSELQARGVVIPDRRQVYIDGDVLLNRILPGAVLHPGTRLGGRRTFLGRGVRVGTEGAAVLENAAFADGAEVASGYVKDAVLLDGARLGANAHVRPYTLLEEGASTAHAVGLKQTILMAFVTTGSLINFCDALMSGGRSQKDHSEIGSGFVHFNFTPFGEFGDKATPSIAGDVSHGVFLREDRIFLGGMSGMVGPQKVGFGAVTIAGQILRRQVTPGHLFGSAGVEIDKPFSRHRQSAPAEKVGSNVAYIRQLFALKAWYQDVRLARVPGDAAFAGLRIVLEEALAAIEGCLEERVTRLNDLLGAFGESLLRFESKALPCPLPLETPGPYLGHIEWVRSLSDEMVLAGQSWLDGVANGVVTHPA